MLTQSEIAHYVQKRKEGWDNSQVRKEIKRKFRLEDSEVSYYVSEIDDLYVESLLFEFTFSPFLNSINNVFKVDFVI